MSMSTGPGRPLRAMWNASLKHARDVLDGGHQPGVLDDRHRDALDVGLLERVGADQVRRHLAGDADDRRRVEVGVGDRSHQVGRPGAGRGDGDADPAGRPGVALGHVAGALLVAHEVVADRCGRRRPRVVQRQDRAARKAEHVGHALGLEAADDRLGAGHLRWLATGDHLSDKGGAANSPPPLE